MGEFAMQAKTRLGFLGLVLILFANPAWSSALPLGDHKISVTPRGGYLMSCVRHWRRGPFHGGPWIQGNDWFPSQKPHVEGDVHMSGHQFSIQHVGHWLDIYSNDIPAHGVGIYPIRWSDPVHKYDPNPNSIRPQDIHYQLPYHPRMAATPTCVPMGPIGIALDGTPIFSAVDNGGIDAVAHEVQDRCNGHPNHFGMYHYHGPSSCMPNEKTSGLVGYALDGYGIYGMRDLTTGKILTTSELGACHGIVSRIRRHGKIVKMFHYVLTKTYPYTVGCFRGSVNRSNLIRFQPRQIRRFDRRYGSYGG